jgi:hypothetical protein
MATDEVTGSTNLHARDELSWRNLHLEWRALRIASAPNILTLNYVEREGVGCTFRRNTSSKWDL